MFFRASFYFYGVGPGKVIDFKGNAEEKGPFFGLRGAFLRVELPNLELRGFHKKRKIDSGHFGKGYEPEGEKVL